MPPLGWLHEGLSSRAAPRRGLTQQRIDQALETSSRSVVHGPLLKARRTGEFGMIIIGVDPHKRVHTATAVDAATNRRLASLEIDASLAGYRHLARWAGGFAEHTWAVENAR